MTGRRATAGADNNDDDIGALRCCGLPNWTRLLSRVLEMGRLCVLMMRQLCVTRQRSRRRWHSEEDIDYSNESDDILMCAGDENPAEEFTSLASADFCFMETSSSFEHAAEKFTFAQLEAATKGFAPEAKIIGMGSSFGSVYRGNLPDGRQVAIKRAESRHRFQLESSAFRSEVSYLSHLRHRHLVGLVGYCCQENEEGLLLVYEYMENGVLSDHLHPKAPAATPSNSSPSPVISSWKLRIKILLDASRGVEFLHGRPCIIHGNIKSSNILLDAGWTARVSDFSLAHQTSEEAAGMVDAEYDDDGLRRRPTAESDDVYGFGVVMLEVLTGKRAAAISEESDPDDGGSGSLSVVDYAVTSIVAGELGKVLDPRAPEPAAHEAEALGLVAYTALHCVLSLEGKGRPAMAAIVASLKTALALCEGRAQL